MARSRAFGLLTVGAALALLLGPIGSAAAHDMLVGTVPAQDATVDVAPTSVTLELSNPPQSLGTEILVTGPGGPASVGAPDMAGTTVTQQLDEGLPAGSYTVDWRVTSADGHPLVGTFTFDVARDSPATVPAAAAEAASPQEGDLAPAPSESSFPVVWVAVALIAAAAVLVAVRQLRRPA